MFYDHTTAEIQLRQILSDEISFYSNGQLAEPEDEDAEDNDYDEELAKKLDHYGLSSMMPQVKKKQDMVLKSSIEFEKINQVWELNKSQTKSDEFQYSPKSHPLFRLLQTLIMIAEIKSFKLQDEAAIEIYEFIKKKLQDVHPANMNM